MGVILASSRLDRVRLLVLRREALGLRLLRQRVRFVDPKFLWVGFRVQIPSDLAMERDSLLGWWFEFVRLV